MSLYYGPGWIAPTRKQEDRMTIFSAEARQKIQEGVDRYWRKRKAKEMTTKSVKGYVEKDGKLVKKAPKMAAGQKRNKALKTARLAKQWAQKSRGNT